MLSFLEYHENYFIHGFYVQVIGNHPNSRKDTMEKGN